MYVLRYPDGANSECGPGLWFHGKKLWSRGPSAAQPGPHVVSYCVSDAKQREVGVTDWNKTKGKDKVKEGEKRILGIR